MLLVWVELRAEVSQGCPECPLQRGLWEHQGPELEGVGSPRPEGAPTLKCRVYADTEGLGRENRAQFSGKAWAPPRQKRK